jgi:hypothetical protein
MSDEGTQGKHSSMILHSIERGLKKNPASRSISTIATLLSSKTFVRQSLDVYVADHPPDLGRAPTRDELVAFIVGLYGDTPESVEELKQAAEQPGALDLFMETWDVHHLHINNVRPATTELYTGSLPMTKDKDDRVECANCNKLTTKLTCAAARDGKLDGPASKWYKPALTEKRRCQSFGKSKHPVSIPDDVPFQEIRKVNIYNSGFHPHDKSWLTKTITTHFAIPSDETAQRALRNDVMSQYKTQFRTAYDAFEGAQHGREGHARNVANQWLQGKILSQKEKPDVSMEY